MASGYADSFDLICTGFRINMCRILSYLDTLADDSLYTVYKINNKSSYLNSLLKFSWASTKLDSPVSI